MFGLKNEITEAFAADCFVWGLLPDLEEAYPLVVEQLGKLNGKREVRRLPENAKEIVSLHVFALEMIALRNFFPEDQVRRMRRLCAEQFAAKRERTVEEIVREISTYERLCYRYTDDPNETLSAVTRSSTRAVRFFCLPEKCPFCNLPQLQRR